MSRFGAALPAFVVALAGAGLAWLGFKTSWLVPVIAVLATAGTAYGLVLAGRAAVTSRPVRAIRLFECNALVLGAAAAAASGLLIAVSVWLTAPKNASTQTTKLLAASVAALSGFLTTLIIKDANESDATWVGAPTRTIFQEKFVDRFPPESRAALAVFSDTFEGQWGWGRKARRARARAISEALASAAPSSVQPPGSA